MAFDAFWRALRRRDAADRGSLVVLRTVGSSHDLARRVVREYTNEGSCPPPCDVLAWEQTAGRGRHDRPWTSPPGGGVYCSLIRPIDHLPVDRLTLAVPVALASALCERLDAVRLEWPNDLVVDGRKLGGILLDIISPSNGSPVAVISFGINVDADLSRCVPRATSLAAEVASVDASGDGLASLADALVQSIDRALDSPSGDVLERYRELSAHAPGDPLEARLGDEVVRGTFDGFDEHGFLRLATADGGRRLVAGELTAGAESGAESGADPDA